MTWRESSFSASETACVELAWRKSGNSGTTACVELAWRKSTFTHPDNCVEVAWPVDRVAMRDSKNPGGPMLTFDPTTLAALVATISAPAPSPRHEVASAACPRPGARGLR